MKERLVIKNFGPIKEADLTFGRFNVLIGEQATGKSTVAKLLCMCRFFSYIVNFDYWEKEGSSFSYGMVEWGLEGYIEPNTYVEYSCQDYDFIGIAQKTPYDQWVDDAIIEAAYEVVIDLKPKSERFKTLLFELDNLNVQSSFDGRYSISETPPTFFRNNVAGVMDNPFYVRTERSLQSVFSLGKNSVQNLDDALYSFFTDLDKIARSFKSEKEILPLEITYKNENGFAYIRKNSEGRFLSLHSAASGYQSTIPIVLVVDYYSEIKKKKKTFIIEEPELNLFPTAQDNLMKFLVDKTMNYGNTMLIATHSPYVLSSLNNLMNAYQSGQKDPDATEAIIPKEQWLNPDDVSAYVLKPDGTCEDIIDYEEGMIKSQKIDEVSGILNRSFDKLLNIQFGIKDAQA